MSSSSSSPSGFAKLRNEAPVILPSVLQCDFGNLEREIRQLEEAGALGIHLDVMDGNFVPNLSFGFPVIEAIRRLTELPLDVHLMISNPQQYVARYVEAGADIVTVHAEVLDELRPLLEEIRRLGARSGLAINPPTPVETIAAALPWCDLVLVMSVMPGYGGQAFDHCALDKLRWLRAELADRVSPDDVSPDDVSPEWAILEVDGGVNEQTIAACVAAGAQALVVGSAITGQADYATKLAQLKQLAHANL
jgi:ribulose-phosphate 3-epimerase